MQPYKMKRYKKRAAETRRRRWMDLARARTLALENIENDPLGEPEFGSYVVLSVHRLWKKPIGEFTVEELRLMVGQGLGLPWLVPLALERLEKDPFVEGDFYPGDLLSNVLSVLDDYLELDGRCLGEIVRVGKRARAMIAASEAGSDQVPGMGQHRWAPRRLVMALDKLLAKHGDVPAG